MDFLKKLKEKLPFSMGGGEKKDDSTPEAVQIIEPKVEPAVEPSEKKESFFSNMVNKVKGLVKKDKKGESVEEPLETPRPTPIATSSVLDSIVKNTEKGKEESLLEAPPALDDSLLDAIEPPRSILLYVLKGALSMLIAVGIGSVAFFTSQLTYQFSFMDSIVEIPSLINDLDSSNEELLETQTKYNMYKYLQGKQYLNRFSYEGDDFIRNYYIISNKSMSQSDRTKASEDMEGLKEKIIEAFNTAGGFMLGDLHVTLIGDEYDEEFQFRSLFASNLNKTLLEEAKEFQQSENDSEKLEYKLYRDTSKLVENAALLALLRTSDLEKMEDLELAKIIVSMNDTVVNELSTIQLIKDDRINWSDVMNEIEVETSRVDQYFSKDFFDQFGGIQYTSYDFDSESSKIVITGNTKRFDSTNFTLISNLIDQLNESHIFKNVEMRSFTKSGSAEDEYTTSTLRLNLQLQTEALHDSDTSVDIYDLPSFMHKDASVPAN